MDMKCCRRCQVDKPVSEFSSEKANRDGLKPYCRPCMAEKARIRRSDPVKAEMDRRASAAWKVRNPTPPKPRKTPARGTPEWRERRAWAQRVSVARFQAKRFGASVNDLRLAGWLAVLAFHENRCFYCDSTEGLWIEHLTPLAEGGDNTAANVVPACEPCNRRKARRTLEQFLANECKNGHPQTPQNVYVYPDGKKKACRPCVRAAEKRHKARKALRKAKAHGST